MTTSAQEQVLAYLKGHGHPNSKGRVKRLWPFHPDTDASLLVYPSGAARCFGGCDRFWRPREFSAALAELTGAPLEREERPSWRRLARWQDPEAVYPYHDAQGNLLYQVLRLPGKDFRMRRPDPGSPGGWSWNVPRRVKVLYRLAELHAAPLEQWVFVPKGEKDVDRLRLHGLVATTNPNGAGKWLDQYNQWFAGRRVALLPDKDDVGRKHADQVARSLVGVAATIRLLELPDVSPKGDVSDWLDAGHPIRGPIALAEATPAFIIGANGHRQPEDLSHTISDWEELGGKLPRLSRDLIQQGLLKHGFFIRTGSAEIGELYYFDGHTRAVIPLDSREMKVLLNTRYRVNSSVKGYQFLLADMEAEAATSGVEAKVLHFAHYAPETNVMHVDLGRGDVLRLDGHSTTIDNGSEGVLFKMGRYGKPWAYHSEPPPGLLETTLISSVNFMHGEDVTLTPEEQRHLMLLGLLSLAFGSILPTKPMARAIGESESGKSYLMRRVGQLLYGESFNVIPVKASEKGEEDFWTTVTTRSFAAFDNVDKPIRWLEDVLATASTGTQISKRHLHTTNEEAVYEARAFLGLTARTPRFRREDVASRMLILHLDRLLEKKAEGDLQREVMTQRDLILSEYAHILNRVVAQPSVPWEVPSISV